MSRTRLIFQNLNLYVGPAGISGSTATGGLYSAGNTGSNLIAQLSRVQSANLTATIDRTDINEFGRLNRIDQMIVNPPKFDLDFSYYSTNGMNERWLGFDISGNAFINPILTKVADSKNYFISVSPQGQDDDGYTDTTTRSVYALGNGFISSYALNLAVGKPADATVRVEALNIASYLTSSGNSTPAVDPSS